MLHYNEEIEVTAYNSESEPSRLTRINRVIGFVCALAEIKDCVSIFWKVSRLHDHKGNLTVTWKIVPTALECRLWQIAWQSPVGDGPCGNIDHDLIPHPFWTEQPVIIRGPQVNTSRPVGQQVLPISQRKT